MIPGPAVVLRPLSWRDIPELAALETALFGPDAWSEASWWAELAGRPRRHYVVVPGPGEAGEPGGPGVGPRIDGYAGVDVAGEVADVMTIAVAPRARGRGLGRLLLDHLVDAARAAGAAHLMLEVRADNAAARRLYADRGFTDVSVRRRYYQPGDIDAHVLRLPLTADPRADEETPR